jgi:hypothetical protein
MEGIQKSSPPFEKGRTGGIYEPSFQKTKLIQMFYFSTNDDLVKSHNFIEFVIPAKAGIQFFQWLSNLLDPGFHRGDGQNSIFSHLQRGAREDLFCGDFFDAEIALPHDYLFRSFPINWR